MFRKTCAALALAGAEMQTTLNNPLASPFTLGVSSAASLGAALATGKPQVYSVVPGPGFLNTGAALLTASAAVKDSLRVVHAATGRAFGNWPTSKTPLHHVSAATFSPHSGYVTIGNDKGRVLLYRVRHYDSA